MTQSIVIYQDEGVGEFGAKCLAGLFRGDDVWMASAEAVIDGRILQMADIFIMPGGADLPYCKKLNGAGNKNIRAFVEDGGTYLGICAGAYYACSALEFHKGRSDEISGPRELALIDAVAYGSLPELAPYYDLTPLSASIVELSTEDGPVKSFYHGGPSFRFTGDKAYLYASFAQHDGAAIITRDVGDGRVVLSGAHLEVGADDLASYPVETAEEKSHIEKLARMLAGSNSKDILKDLLA